MKQCYRNAGNFVLEHEDDYWYCEGLAVSSIGHSVPHAWICPAFTSKAIDLTWKEPGRAYFGVALDERGLVKQMNTLKANGPFAEIIEPSDLIGP